MPRDIYVLLFVHDVGLHSYHTHIVYDNYHIRLGCAPILYIYIYIFKTVELTIVIIIYVRYLFVIIRAYDIHKSI